MITNVDNMRALVDDTNSSTAALVEDRDESNDLNITAKCTTNQKKRKRWKTLFDGLKLGRKRKSTKSRQTLEEVDEKTSLEEVYHILTVMESLYQAEERMLQATRDQLQRQTEASRDRMDRQTDNGSGVECLIFEEQPNKRMKLGRSCCFEKIGSTHKIDQSIAVDLFQDNRSRSSTNYQTLRSSSSDMQKSILSIWSAFHRVDIVALFEGANGNEEVEVSLMDEDNIQDMVMDMPWAFTPEQKSEILGTLVSLASSTFSDVLCEDDDVFEDGTVVSWSGVSPIASYDSSLKNVPLTLNFTCHSRHGSPAVNPWAAAKRGNLAALQVIAATHDPSCWDTRKFALNAVSTVSLMLLPPGVFLTIPSFYRGRLWFNSFALCLFRTHG